MKPFVALIVLALWASCAVRCDLVSLACFEEGSCCDSDVNKSPEKPAPADHCVCSWVRSGGYISEKSAVPLPCLDEFPLFTFPAYLEISLPDARASEMTFPPPELLTSWHISNRAAAAPRAPSIAS